MNTLDIGSIGWLNCADGSINLTPVFKSSNGHAVMVNISMSDFEAVRSSKELMKNRVIDVLKSK